MSLDKIIPNDARIMIYDNGPLHSEHITGEQLKSAIRAEIAERIKAAMLKDKCRHLNIELRFGNEGAKNVCTDCGDIL